MNSASRCQVLVEQDATLYRSTHASQPPAHREKPAQKSVIPLSQGIKQLIERERCETVRPVSNLQKEMTLVCAGALKRERKPSSALAGFVLDGQQETSVAQVQQPAVAVSTHTQNQRPAAVARSVRVISCDMIETSSTQLRLVVEIDGVRFSGDVERSSSNAPGCGKIIQVGRTAGFH